MPRPRVLSDAGFYDSLLAFFDKCLEEGFLRPEARAIVVVRNTPEELMDALEAYTLPQTLIEKLREQSTAADKEPDQYCGP